jgi:hypothetical protein
MVEAPALPLAAVQYLVVEALIPLVEHQVLVYMAVEAGGQQF